MIWTSYPEVKYCQSTQTRNTISKGGDVTNAEPMEYRGPKVTGKIKEGHLSEPTLSRPDPSIMLYIKIYCSNDGIGAVILQVDVS